MTNRRQFLTVGSAAVLGVATRGIFHSTDSAPGSISSLKQKFPSFSVSKKRATSLEATVKQEELLALLDRGEPIAPGVPVRAQANTLSFVAEGTQITLRLS